jgi:hypothetical protein
MAERTVEAVGQNPCQKVSPSSCSTKSSCAYDGIVLSVGSIERDLVDARGSKADPLRESSALAKLLRADVRQPVM